MSRTGLMRPALAALLVSAVACAPVSAWAELQGTGEVDATESSVVLQQDDQVTDFVIDEDGVLTGYIGAGGDVVIPDGVTKIGSWVFSGKTDVTSVSIPDSVKEIGMGAFSGCSLSSVDLGHGVEVLDTAAFENLNVDELVIPSSIREDGGVGGFLGATIGTVIFEEGTEIIPHFMFGDRNTIRNVVIPEGVTKIGYNAFGYVAGLQEIALPDTVTLIEHDAFSYMPDLRSVHISSGLGSEQASVDSPFRGSMGIESVTFGEGIVALPDTLFDGAGIAELHIPDTVISIGERVFTCTNEGGEGADADDSEVPVPSTVIKDLYLPASVTSIDDSNTLDGVTVHTVKNSTACQFAEAKGYVCVHDMTHDHEFGEWTTVKDPTCTEAGVQRRVCWCEEVDERSFPGPLGHDFSGDIVVDTEPTCTDAGSGHRVCSRCQLVSPAEEIGSLGHAYFDEWVVDVEPTCTASGERSHHCSRCGARTDVEIVDPLGHSYGDWIVDTPATYFASGAQHRFCDRCDVREDGVIAQLEPDFATHPDYTFATFRVVNARTLEPLAGATIALTSTTDKDETQELTTDDLGRAAFFAPAGSYDVLVGYAQFQMRGFTYTFAMGEVQVPEVGLSPEAIVQGEITAKEMTQEEIEAAGIDTSDPANNHVYQYGGAIRFEQGIEGLDFGFETYVYKNENGETVGAAFDGKKVEKDEDGNDKPMTICVSGPEEKEPTKVTRVNEYLYLVTTGEVKWQKEMFHVQLIVVNMSNSDTLEDCIASLNLPHGLSLATMTDGTQEAQQEIGTVDHLETKMVDWYVRGDESGDFTLEATLDGSFAPLDIPFTYTFRSAEPLHVYAGSDMKLTIHLSDAAYFNEPYTILYELENVSDRTIYNVTHKIEKLSQFEGKYTHLNSDEAVEDAQEWVELTTEELEQGATISTEALKPGERMMAALTTNIIWKSSMVKAGENAELTHKIMVAIGANKGFGAGIDAILQLMANMDIRYYLDDTVVATLEGSTAEIPTDFEVEHHGSPTLVDEAISSAVSGVWDKGVSFGLKFVMGEDAYNSMFSLKRTYKGITSIFSVETAEENQRCTVWVETEDGSDVIQVSIDGATVDEEGRYVFTGDREISVDALNTGTAYLIVQDEDGNITKQQFEVAEQFPGQEHILSSIKDPTGLNDLLMPPGSIFTEDYYELLDEMGWEIVYGGEALRDGDAIPTGSVLRDTANGVEVNIFVPGDVTEDGLVDASDVAAMMAASSDSGDVAKSGAVVRLSAERRGLSPIQRLAGDLTGDGVVDDLDALELLTYLTDEEINSRLSDVEMAAVGDDGAVLTAERVEAPDGRSAVLLDLSDIAAGATAAQVDLLDPRAAGVEGLTAELVGVEGVDVTNAVVSDKGDYVRAIVTDLSGVPISSDVQLLLSCSAAPTDGAVTLPARILVETKAGVSIAAVRAVTLDFATADPEPVPGVTELVVDLPEEGFFYSGTELDLSDMVTAFYGDSNAVAEVVWSWRSAEAAGDEAWQSGLPTDAGSYVLRAVLPERPAVDGMYFKGATWEGTAVIMPALTEAPDGISGLAERVAGSGGTLADLPKGIEWRLKGSDVWTAAAGDTVSVAPGVYEVRFAASADGNYAASPAVEIRVSSFADEHGGIVFPEGSTEDASGMVILPDCGGTVIFPGGSSIVLPGSSLVDSDASTAELAGGATVALAGDGNFVVTLPDGVGVVVPSGTELAVDGSVVGSTGADQGESGMPGIEYGNEGESAATDGNGSKANDGAEGIPATGDYAFVWGTASVLLGVAALLAARRRG